MSDKRRRHIPQSSRRKRWSWSHKQDYTVAQAARSLGISRICWIGGAGSTGRGRADAFPGTGHQSAEVEELNRLREENRRLKLEREILKKAAAFFARESG